jgi:flagellar biosynthesis protein FlhG
MKDNLPTPKKPMRIISVTGGKGGIGKTTISVNLAIAFSKMKKKVLLFDADLGLANVDLMLGLTPEKTIFDVFSGKCAIKDVCLEGPHGLKIIPSSSGIQKMADLSLSESVELIRSFSLLTEDLDVMIIDMASGISNQVLDFTHASQDIMVVICNDPASMMDSYAVIKILHQKYARSRFGIVVNKVKSSNEAVRVFSRFQATTAKFLNLSLQYLGHVPDDDYIKLAARERVAVCDQFPRSISAMAFNNLCQGVNNWQESDSVMGGIHFFFDRLTL